MKHFYIKRYFFRDLKYISVNDKKLGRMHMQIISVCNGKMNYLILREFYFM